MFVPSLLATHSADQVQRLNKCDTMHDEKRLLGVLEAFHKFAVFVEFDDTLVAVAVRDEHVTVGLGDGDIGRFAEVALVVAQLQRLTFYTIRFIHLLLNTFYIEFVKNLLNFTLLSNQLSSISCFSLPKFIDKY